MPAEETETQAPGTRRTRSSGTRDAIILAAATIFGDRGYEASSIDDVAQQAGVTKATIYYHFASKEELYTAARVSLLERSSALAREAIRDLSSPLAELVTLVEVTISQTLDRNRRYVFYHEIIPLRPELRRALAAAQRDYAAIVENVVAAGQRVGHIIEGAPKIIVSILLGTIARTVSWYRDTGEVGPDEFMALLRSMILNGVVTEKGRKALAAK